MTGPGASIESLKLKESEKDDTWSGERQRIAREVSWKGDSGRIRGEGEVAGRGWRLRIMLHGSMEVTKCQ